MLLTNKPDTPMYQLYSRCYESILKDNSYLAGRLLTLSDASFSDPQQRKAFKDLISQEIDAVFRERTRDTITYYFNEMSKLNGDELFPDWGKPYAIPEQTKKPKK